VLVLFINEAMHPSRFVNDYNRFTELQGQLNDVLALFGYWVNDEGKLAKTRQATTPDLNLGTDGEELYTAVFGGKSGEPLVHITPFRTESDKSEHRGFKTLLTGIHGHYRNPLLTTPITRSRTSAKTRVRRSANPARTGRAVTFGVSRRRGRLRSKGARARLMPWWLRRSSGNARVATRSRCQCRSTRTRCRGSRRRSSLRVRTALRTVPIRSRRRRRRCR
jgi:hypothetical protein